MAFLNLLPRTVDTTGASCTGSDGETNRTYTLPDNNVVSGGMSIVVDGTSLTSSDYTLSSNVITFLNALWDSSSIKINYFITFGNPASATISTSTDLKYATPQQLAEMLGLARDIPSWDTSGTPSKEEVGTGDNSTTTFYLDHHPIISDSYTLYHGASEDSLTTLTETTHYNLDTDTGEIVLTSAGVTEVGTDKIYAAYQYYSNGMKDSYVISVLARAQAEVDRAVNSTFTDGNATHPEYPLEIEIQPTEGMFQDRFITKRKPLIDVSSMLASDITSTDTSITLSTGDGDKFPSSGYIIIGSEVITYTGVSDDTLTGCSRGVLDTTAASHSAGDEVHTTIVFRSDTDEGTEVSWTVQPWETSAYVKDTGLIYIYYNADPTQLSRLGVAERFKIIYYYGYNTVPADITRLTLLLAKRMLIQDNIGKSLIAGRNEFRPEMFNVDQAEIDNIINSYVVIPMGNT